MGIANWRVFVHHLTWGGGIQRQELAVFGILKSRLVQVLAASVLLSGAIGVVVGSGAADAGGWGPPMQTLVVSNHTQSGGSYGQGQGGAWGCGHATYSTIGAALAAANPGATVIVCPGTYAEDAVITKPVTLIGQNATINATDLPGAPIGSILGQAPYNGITIESSNVTVKGFTVEGAQGEGILAINPNPVVGPVVQGMQLYTGTPITHVTIEDNDVTGNDLGFGLATSPYAFCTPNGGGDCGEGIHLLSVAYSSVINNQSVGNAGGILLTDEFGANHDNLVEGNYVEGNTKDCGITLPSHNLGLNPTTGQLDPSFGGVYNNWILNNKSIDNGVEGYGAGIGVFAPESYTASYDNVISGNYIEGNGLAGISVHSHAANAYVNGNVFIYNTIGKNNVDLADGTDSTPISNETTGILIWSDATPYSFVVAKNTIFDNTYGVWLTPSTVSAVGLNSNRFIGVTTPVFDAS
jgi:nitrous oxidase accessory protein NosD